MCRFAWVVVGGLLLSPAADAYYAATAKKPVKETGCRMVRVNRHRPKVCLGPGCEKCPNSECAKKPCGGKTR